MNAAVPMLELLNVESAYGPIKAIRGVSLKVQPGEIATVLGSNGAGKTTILKTISGIIDPRRGTVHFKGQDITANDPAAIVRLGLVQVPEGREVFPLLSVHDNLLMGAYTRADRDGVARDIEQVAAEPARDVQEGLRRPGALKQVDAEIPGEYQGFEQHERPHVGLAGHVGDRSSGVASQTQAGHAARTRSGNAAVPKSSRRII